MYELLEQEMQILAADAQAVEMQNEIRQRLKIAEMKVILVPMNYEAWNLKFLAGRIRGARTTHL